MSAKLIDGKAQAADLLSEISKQVRAFRDEHGLPPGLAVILVGEDPASAVYVKSKIRKSESAGMRSYEDRLSADITQEELIAKIRELNARPDIHGILVQMPLPGHIDERAVVDAIDPAKDVDGLHPANAGRLVLGSARLVSCTPQGCIILAKSVLGEDLSGLEAVVLGRSILVGKPVALLLQNENCTVTMLHSRSRNMIEHCRRADILVVATGRAKMVQGDWIKPGATVIDVGINRITEARGGEEKGVLVGDVDFEAAVKVAGAITPVPGGVGPMTVACLLANTLTAARLLVAK